MTKTTTNLLLMLITILAGTYFYITYCSECGSVDVPDEPLEETVMPAEPEATSFPLAFSDGNYAYNSNDNFNSKNSSSSILMPLHGNMKAGINSLKSFQYNSMLHEWYD
ncbi:hypothetical protein [Maribacter aestuarii]|uniref:hypothetical protein n=1 Tax=Maribacter aestuarii TaxID=1130723 RepID=UPI00248B751D|nr:hypothetical protein [Maribacter aestuarii]